MKHFGYWMVVFLFTASCSNSKEQAVFKDQFRWLAGQWQGQNGDVTMIERWRWENGQYKGDAFEIKGDDTLFSEQIFLQSIDQRPAYVVAIPNRDLCLFEGIQQESELWVFENKQNDFPSRIQYRIEGDSAITVSLYAKDKPFRGEHSYQLIRGNR